MTLRMNPNTNLNRRQVARKLAAPVLGGLMLRPAWGADERPRFASLDHVEFSASDLMRTVAFYTRIFGNDLYKNKRVDKHYLKLGPTYLGIDKGVAPLKIDHHSVGIANLDMAAVHAYLERQGVPYKDYPSGRDTSFIDPDGTKTQLSAEHSWSSMVPNTAAPEEFAIEGPPIFRATGMEHILLNVSDPEKSAEFYARIFGPVSRRNNNRIWFQIGTSRVGLLKTPAGAKAGVNHYCVSAEAFEYAATVKKLEQAGAKMEEPEIAGAPQFRDPDGYLVQVMPASRG